VEIELDKEYWIKVKEDAERAYEVAKWRLAIIAMREIDVK
jgi:hypothetical protein